MVIMDNIKDNKAIKWSRYNFLIKSKKTERCFLYSSLSNILFELTDNEFDVFNNIKNNINKIDILDKETISNLQKYKFFVKDDNLEYIKYKLAIQSRRYNKEEMLLAISLNNKSNINKCSKVMNKDIECNIIQFIKSHSALKKIHLIWYETNIMSLYQKVEHITKGIKSLNINVIKSTILLHGVDLLKIDFKKIISLNINNVNIVFSDFNDEPIYSINLKKIIKSIELLSTFKELHISVYLHHKKGIKFENTFYDIKRICIKKNINTYSLSEHCHECIDNQLFNKKKKLLSLPSKMRLECIARHMNGFILDPEGYIYKCWFDVGNKNRVIGQVTDRFNENIDLYASYLGLSDPFEDTKCISCSFLPICGGGCPRKRMEKEYFLINDENCAISKEILTDIIEDYYLNKISK